MDHQSRQDDSELAIAFGLLLIAQNENSNEDFSTLLPDIVPAWAAVEEPNRQLDCDWSASNHSELTPTNAEKADHKGRIIRRASRRSSIIRLPGTSNENSIQALSAGPSQIKVESELTAPSPEEKSEHLTVHSSVNAEDRCKHVEARSLKIPKPKSSKCPSKPTHDLPLAEKMQRYFNEVPSRFHSFPKKRVNGQPTVAAKRKSVAVQNPMLSRSSSVVRGKENKPDVGSNAFQPPNLSKLSTKFIISSKPDLHKFTARPVPCKSIANPPTKSSAVLEESNGKIEMNLINAHVGVPQSGCSGGRKLVVKPFSFIERHERARKLREEKLRQAIEESVRFPKFKANPLPSYLTEKSNTEASSKRLPRAEKTNKKGGKENLS